MSRNHLKSILGILLLGVLAGFPVTTSATDSVLSQEADGLTVHLGIMSAKRLVEHPELLPAGYPIRPGRDMHHILVAIFDSATGQRITDAEVEAMVFPLGLSGSTKVMHPSAPAGKMNYSNWFRLSPGDIYVIQVRIRRPGIRAVRTARFTLKRFAG